MVESVLICHLLNDASPLQLNNVLLDLFVQGHRHTPWWMLYRRIMPGFHNKAVGISDMPVTLEHILVFSARYSGTLDITSCGPQLLT